MLLKTAIALLLFFVTSVRSDPTWPAATDEMEEIMYQLYGSGARLFADNITPCSKETHGVGRKTASEWLRVAFHDVSRALCPENLDAPRSDMTCVDGNSEHIFWNRRH